MIFRLNKQKSDFSMYRRTYNFSDKEVMVFLSSLGLFFMFLIYSFMQFSIIEIESKLFFMFLLPVIIFIIFDLKATFVNRKRKRVLFKRKLSKADTYKKVFIAHEGENNLLASKFSPEEQFELDKKKYIDINYELKTKALENGYDAILGLKNENGKVKGFFAKKSV